MSGGGGGTQTIQKSDPWSGIQPYLRQMYADANNIAAQGYAIPQNTGVADLNQTSQNALNAAINRSSGTYNDATMGNNAAAMSNGNDWISQILAGMSRGQDAGSQAAGQVINGNTAATKALTGLAQGTDASSQYLRDVLGGKYLTSNTNPYLSGAVDAANADATRQFQTAVMPQLASQFSAAGRYGSGAQSQGVSDATNNLAKVLSNNANQIYYQNYQNERNNQTGAAGTLSGIQAGAAGALGGLQNQAIGTLSGNMQNGAQALSNRSLTGNSQLALANQLDWNNILNGMNAASVYQQQDQNQLEGANNLFNQNQQMKYNNLQWLAGILQGTAGLGGQSSTQQSGGGMRNAFGGALGGAATGAAIGSAVPGIGTALGAGIGGLGGLLMGVL